MKEDNFFNPYTQKSESEYHIHIERDDIEQALSWFDRLPINKISDIDEKIYRNLRKVVAYMRSLRVE